jgi:hypothetical protein
MRRLLTARLILTAIGVAVWAYGQRFDLPRTRVAGMGILAVSLLLRFVPTRWLGEDNDPPSAL